MVLDRSDTDLGTTSPQKLANEVREPKAYILILSLVCFECGICHLAYNTFLKKESKKEELWRLRRISRFWQIKPFVINWALSQC